MPEVKRNRLVTNWVMVRAGQSTSTVVRDNPRGKIRGAVLITALCLVLVSGAGTVVLNSPIKDDWSVNSALASQAELATDASADGTDPTAQDPCGSEAPALIAGEKPSRVGAPSVEGFEAMASHAMGGILIADYKCASSRSTALIRVRWEIANSTWQLKQISRPPLRQSGDF